MKVTLGGERLGSGNKRTQELHNYYRSTFNLDESFKSSLAPGILYPCYINVGTNGDVFDISMDTLIRTIPTRGPLFGTYKMQIDVFSIPIRLYQGILHNNPINIGLDMKHIWLPQVKLTAKNGAENLYTYADRYTSQISTSSLMKFLGLSGIGSTADTATRNFNAVPMLAYYDIFKNYYANKQEDDAYVITIDNQFVNPVGTVPIQSEGVEWCENYVSTVEPENSSITKTKTLNVSFDSTSSKPVIEILYTTPLDEACEITIRNWNETNSKFRTLDYLKNERKISNYTYVTLGENTNTNRIVRSCKIQFDNVDINEYQEYTIALIKKTSIDLVSFPLKNIDQMREDLLKESELGAAFVISESEYGNYLPYSAVHGLDTNGYCKSVHPLDGLVVKTYQSDIFNNWLKTEWIDGENGINAITAISTSGDSFTIDALNLANKVYNMLNRVAITGGTYQDWQEAVYTQKAVRHAETPMWEGGMSTEIVFDEVISTASGEYDGDVQALGSLGGRGKQMGKKGGKVHIKVTEPSFIMAICSITPRINQTQGNMWYLTELQSVDDLHKPALDGIGFQDLICEQMAWWDTFINPNKTLTRHSAGKVPAWINYQTAFDKCYGDFAYAEGKSFMVLNRNYEIDFNNQLPNGIKDVTTYIDPRKFNYVFAYSELDAQNFWVQIDFNVKARRLMSAKQIPNL